MSGNISNTTILKWFIKEEYRVFETLFGSKRLLLFPVMLFAFSLLMGLALPVFDVATSTLTAVFLMLVTLFGLQTGSIGFEARDTLDDLMGDSSRILFSSRTLPISTKKLAGIFLLKDALMYSFFMLLPIFLGAIIGIVFSPIGSATVSISVFSIISVYILVITSFMLGVSVGFVLTSIEFSDKQGLLGVLVMVTILAPTGYFAYQNMNVISSLNALTVIGIQLVLTLIFVLIGLWQFEIASQNKTQNRHRNIFKQITQHLPNNPVNNLVVKTMIDMVRSPGGLWKVVFSTGVISLSVVLLVEVVKEFMITGIRPEALYGSLFALSVFSVYTIVYRYDSETYYSVYPITEIQVRKAKSLTYFISSFIIVGAYYTIAVAPSVGLLRFVLGLFIMTSLIVYQLGVFLLVARDEPLKFLFNGMMFSGYSFALLIVMVPLTMIGLFGSVIPSVVTTIGLIVSVVCLVVGLVLTRIAIYKN